MVRAVGVVEPESLGRKMAECFIVEVRVRLISSDDAKLEFPSVGILFREKKRVLFEPARDLPSHAKERRLLLEEFLDKQIGVPDVSKQSSWRIVFQESPDPILGLDLLGRFGSDLLRFHIYKTEDRLLKKLSLEKVFTGICYVVHDAICCGAGIKLETIGTVYPYPKLKFEEDKILTDRIRSVSDSNRPNSGTSDFKVSDEINVSVRKAY